MSERIAAISFVIFVTGLCSLVVGVIYEQRFLIFNDLYDTYSALMIVSLSQKLAFCIGAITIISFVVCVFSIPGEEKINE